MSSSGYTAISFVANEQPTTAKWNLIGSNDSSFNLGTGLEDGVILNRHIGVNAVAANQLATTAILLGQSAAGTAFTTTSTSDVLVTGSNITVTQPAGGRKIIFIFTSSSIWNSAGGLSHFKLWRDGVGSGTLLGDFVQNMPSGNSIPATIMSPPDNPAAGSHTYSVSASAGSGTTHSDTVQTIALLA